MYARPIACGRYHLRSETHTLVPAARQRGTQSKTVGAMYEASGASRRSLSRKLQSAFSSKVGRATGCLEERLLPHRNLLLPAASSAAALLLLLLSAKFALLLLLSLLMHG